MVQYWLPETMIHVDGTVFVVINDIPMESPRKKYSTDGDLWVLPINFEPICIKN